MRILFTTIKGISEVIIEEKLRNFSFL